MDLEVLLRTNPATSITLNLSMREMSLGRGLHVLPSSESMYPRKHSRSRPIRMQSSESESELKAGGKVYSETNVIDRTTMSVNHKDLKRDPRQEI